jgi:hypothetical protein
VALKAQSALLAANMLPRQHAHDLRRRPSPGITRSGDSLADCFGRPIDQKPVVFVQR